MRFLRDNARWLSAGGLLVFSSSFGQTYFIALYAGYFRETFALSHADWGAIYAAGTFASAAMMLVVGGLVDHVRIRDAALVVLACFAGVAVLVSQISAVWMLPILIFGLRFCGQGLMGHIGMVGTARWFAARRGRALSIVAMGFGLGEALLPVTFVAITALIGWRSSWLVASLLLLAMMPVVTWLLARERQPSGTADDTQTAGLGGQHWTRRMAVSHWLFWALVPGLLAQPVFGTAFFFQQVHMVEIKGWTLAAFAAAIPIYTAFNFAGLFAGGIAVDRLGATSLMPVYLLPMATGLVIIASTDSFAIGAVALGFLGVTQGLSAVILGALWPEVYGTRNLGAIRSVTSALMVFATALGPALTGYLIDAGVSYNLQLVGMAVYILCVAVLNAVAMARLRISVAA